MSLDTYTCDVERLLTDSSIISYFTSTNKNIIHFIKTYIEVDKILDSKSSDNNLLYHKLDEIKNTLTHQNNQINTLTSNNSLLQQKLENIKDTTNNELKSLFNDLQKQIQYNTEHNITPTTIIKSIEQVMKQTAVLDIKGFSQDNINIRTTDGLNMVAEPNSQYETIPQMEKAILQTKKQMEKMAKAMDFMEAAKLRDEMFRMELQLEKMKAS